MSFLKALPAAALLFLPSTAATVHSVSVVPSSGKTEVVIGINAAVEMQNFTLDAPARVVVDLKGATLAMTQRTYDKISRGGITNIRYSQFRPNVVRVVIDLDDRLWRRGVHGTGRGDCWLCFLRFRGRGNLVSRRWRRRSYISSLAGRPRGIISCLAAGEGDAHFGLVPLHIVIVLTIQVDDDAYDVRTKL